ncbi:ankyrin [Annulohypoxylon moriforme]|nr:ankyrin [Annulohypoxylon moriforme]
MTNVRFLVTSRDNQDIRRSLRKFRNIRIEDYVSKVDEDIAKYIDYRLRVDSNLQWLNDHIKDHISKSMQSQAAGMFRWVQCQLEAFSKLRTVKAIRQSLNRLPQDLHETYDRILARIPKADQESARRILLWVAFSVTPLTLEEIHTAIAIEPQMSHLDEESLLRSPHDILDLVGGLVNVTNQGHITLAHMSVKDYLLSSWIRDSKVTNCFALSTEDAYATLFQYCIAYISFDNFKKGPSTTSEDYVERVKNHPLLRHAAISWPYYYRAATPSEDLNSAVMQLFQKENHKLFMSWVQVINADNPFSWDFYPRHATSLYYASTFGLTNIVEELIRLGTDLDLPGSRYGGTALHGAVYRLHTPIVKLLLEAGADVNKADFLKVSPLHTAATLDDIELIQLLLRYSANIKAIDDMGESPIDWALKSGQTKTLSVLQGVQLSSESQIEKSRSTDSIDIWKASSATIPYFPDFHKYRSGMESSIVLRVEIGTNVIKEEEDAPDFSPWTLVPEGQHMLS